MSKVNLTEIQKATSHLIPRHPKPHEAGLQGAAYAGFGVLVYWITTAVSAPPIAAALIAVVACYFIGKQDGRVAWKRYESAYEKMVFAQME